MTQRRATMAASNGASQHKTLGCVRDSLRGLWSDMRGAWCVVRHGVHLRVLEVAVGAVDARVGSGIDVLPDAARDLAKGKGQEQEEEGGRGKGAGKTRSATDQRPPSRSGPVSFA